MEPNETGGDLEVGVFGSIREADTAVEALLRAGFDKDRITVVCPKECRAHYADLNVTAPAGEHTPQALLAGGTIGAVLGGLVAAAGLTAMGGVPLLVAGTLFGGATGAVAGGFLGAMTTRGMEPEIADHYDQALQRGKVLVAVDDGREPARRSVAQRLLRAAGAEPIELRSD